MLATLDSSRLSGVLSAHAASLRYVYLESETRVVLVPFTDYLHRPSSLPNARWAVGRAFGIDLEIRWRQEDLIVEAQSLSENGSAPLGWMPSDWNSQFDPNPQPRRVLLTGINSTRLPPDHVLYNARPEGGLWVSPSVARPLVYPVSDPRAVRVALRCLDYSVNSIVVMTRLVDLVPYDEGE